ncbi:ion transporter [Phaeobacter gallaeciensis]|uniref:Ion channel n=1 Tax=Phaeobacter gallaeciensis TaxID=60890 RepID=A0A1B0ZVX5_9RHOB|nr:MULTISPECIES: ion channel [Phaeobacter]MDF1771681.1 ion channel [Pseudophaeobacter sp. bin_em_oilr2.035]MEE2633562.1 ion channel [Pseudomonadota bacterium]ANP38306.1 ion transporter [Phaeobacter gallaeciensis]MDE4061392.1 ion channel [Phaeobacter gallaeciensis]MDE4124413.1 ion channel [Phaeobacter gallaeciensis]
MQNLKKRINTLYEGASPGAVRFRYGIIIFDGLSILFFIATAHVDHGPMLIAISQLLGVIIGLDLAARLWIARNRKAFLWQIYTLADVTVIVTLLLDPLFSGSLAFLRILRALRLIHSYHLLRDLRRDSEFFRRNEDALLAGINLFVFIFATAMAVLIFFIDETQTQSPYVDALYFTVATLTTTGFGDITMASPAGKMFSVFVMVVGVALFVRLAQAIFQPQKVRYTCPTCGLTRHDIDAVHCKHCGEQLKILTTGVE